MVPPAGEEGRVDVNQVDALAGKLAHNVKIVAPEQPIWLKLGMTKGNALHHLERKLNLGKELAKTSPAVPVKRPASSPVKVTGEVGSGILRCALE